MSELKSKKTKGKKASNILTIITGVFVLILILFQLLGSITARNNFGVPRFGNYSTLIVITDSMEPVLPVGTGIFIEKVDLATIQPSSTIEAKDGDIITFYNGSKIITHRVIEVIHLDNGNINFKTLGDNLFAQTCPSNVGCDPSLNYDYVEGKNVLGKVISKSLAFGKVYEVASSPIFIAVFAVIPIILIFISSVRDLGKQLKTYSPDEGEVNLDEDELFRQIKEQEKLKILIELEKEKLRAEIKEKGGQDLE